MSGRFRMIAGMLACALAACSEVKQEDRETASEEASLVIGDPAPGAGSPEARAYLAGFIQADPDACFNEALLEQADFDTGEGPGPRAPPARVVVVVDGSGSMAARMGSTTRLELAREAALGFVDGLPSSVEAALLVFGHRGDNTEAGKALSCKGIDVLAPMTTDRAPLRDAVGRLRAVGWTPLAVGLERAEALLTRSDTEGEQVIYVVSDGEDTCGGDPVAVARRINGGKTKAIVNIIGFGLPSGDAAALEAVAAAGHGEFVNIGGEAEFDRTMAEVREANRRAANAVRQSNAIAGNAVRTSNAVSKAEVCISDIISGEAVGMSNDLSRLALNDAEEAYHEEAKTLLDQRHDTLQARLDAYVARLTGAEDATRATIDKSAKTAK